ncbi:hypothetical protein BK720_07505 [Bacillus thuringiensis serovar brasilensis]|uniref:hypothetical protein n=1 Tax=Bacillus thuringiensis TaxID=1428 RepID=UPI000A39F7D7|nr:hypothetical protein [Bacillus thuringiensis]OTX35713.1 hypothetical protein BK720_07505 [Bacillus thuringiensis serovar brasilensis]
MNMKRKFLFACTSVLLAIPTAANAKNNDVPFFDGNNETYLKSLELQMPGKYFRPGSGYEPVKTLYKGDIHYPAVYNGSFNWGNPKENLVQSEDTSEPFIRISNEGYFNSSVVLGDRMVTEFERVNTSVIQDKYWGNPDFVLTHMKKHIINSIANRTDFGSFYWIRDIAYLSGGYAGAGAVDGVNKYNLWYVRTSKPQIKDFKVSSKKNELNKPVTFNLNGFEYVSKNKGYNDRDPNGTTVNPYQNIAGERNRIKWELEIEKEGSKVNYQSDYLRSKPQKDNQKPNEGDAGYFSKEGISFYPQECGRYTAKLKVTDGVQRESTEKVVDFVVDGSCGTEVTPNPDPGDEDDFKYKIDFSSDRIEGETAREGKDIKTRVDVSRANFKPERDQYRTKVNNNINKSQQDVSSAESDRDNAQSNLSYCRRNPIKQKDEKGKEISIDRDCSWEENRLDDAVSRIDKARQKLEKEKNKITKLDALEAKYANPETVVVLKHNGQQVASQKVRLTEGEKKNLNLDWKHKGKGTIQAEINPAGNRIDIEETTYKNNPIKTAIYEPSKEKAMCGVTSVKGVVETVSERVSKEDIVGEMYYETLTGSINNLAPSKLHSGYGFSYEVNGKYKNDWNANYPGVFTAAKAQYPFADEGLKSTQDLEKKELKDNTAKLLPKNMYLSEATGHVFDSKRPTKSLYWDGQEKIIDGGQKWYSPLKTKDGVYTFNVETAPAGINEMSLCLTEQVEIKGVAYDDFIKRRVFPDDPFPGGSGVGWNWVGKEELLHKLTDWYYMKNGE